MTNGCLQFNLISAESCTFVEVNQRLYQSHLFKSPFTLIMGDLLSVWFEFLTGTTLIEFVIKADNLSLQKQKPRECNQSDALSHEDIRTEAG